MTSTLENVLFTFPETLNTPSYAKGVSYTVETTLRAYGCELIVKACIALEVTQYVASVAQTYLHRFYMKASLTQYDIKYTSAACFLLACKAAETTRSLDDICRVFYRIFARETTKTPEPMKQDSNEHWEIKNKIRAIEVELLVTMGFQVLVDTPHRYLVYYCTLLGFHKLPNFLQNTWNFASDLMRTTLCLRFSPQTLATACVYISTVTVGMEMPDVPWWELFNANKDDLDEIAWTMATTYNLPKVEYTDVISIHKGKKRTYSDRSDSPRRGRSNERNGRDRSPSPNRSNRRGYSPKRHRSPRRDGYRGRRSPPRYTSYDDYDPRYADEQDKRRGDGYREYDSSDRYSEPRDRHSSDRHYNSSPPRRYR